MSSENTLKEIDGKLAELALDTTALREKTGKLIDFIQAEYRKLQESGNREPDDFIMIALSELDRELTVGEVRSVYTELEKIAEWFDSLRAYTEDEYKTEE